MENSVLCPTAGFRSERPTPTRETCRKSSQGNKSPMWPSWAPTGIRSPKGAPKQVSPNVQQPIKS